MQLPSMIGIWKWSRCRSNDVLGLSVTLVAIYAVLLSTALKAEPPVGFVGADSSCAKILPFRKQWKTLPPVLPDPPKIPLFHGSQASAIEWKRLYLPKRELTDGELQNGTWSDSILEEHRLDDLAEPGLLVNSQPWIDFLRSCPEKILSNRTLSSTAPDWVAPDFFELYSLPLAQQQREVIATRFTDRSSRFGGEYVALYLGDYCPAEKIFVSQGKNQQIEFLQLRGQLVMALKSPQKKLVRYLTFVPQAVDNSYFIEICRTILDS